MRYESIKHTDDEIIITFDNDFEYPVPFVLCSRVEEIWDWHTHLRYKKWYTRKLQADFLEAALSRIVHYQDPFEGSSNDF